MRPPTSIRTALLAALLLALLATVPATADVTLKARSTGKGLGFDSEGVTTTYIQGRRMRSDSEVQGKSMTTILDVDARQMIVLRHDKKQAQVFDLAETAETMRDLDTATQVEMKPLKTSRTVAGQACAEHLMTIRIETHPVPEETVDMVMSGPVCLAKGAPGASDYRTFYNAVAEQGLFFGDPRSAKAQPGQAHGMTVLYRKMAEAGVAMSTDLAISWEGSGLMAKMMKKMAKIAFGQEILEISTATIPSGTFDIPAGYKTKKK